MRRQVTDFQRIFVKDTSDEGLIFKIYKDLVKLNDKKATQFKSRPKTNRHLSKDYTHVLETNTTLYSNFSPIKNKFKKRRYTDGNSGI